jgi:hypothetical protein
VAANCGDMFAWTAFRSIETNSRIGSNELAEQLREETRREEREYPDTDRTFLAATVSPSIDHRMLDLPDRLTRVD